MGFLLFLFLSMIALRAENLPFIATCPFVSGGAGHKREKTTKTCCVSPNERVAVKSDSAFSPFQSELFLGPQME